MGSFNAVYYFSEAFINTICGILCNVRQRDMFSGNSSEYEKHWMILTRAQIL